MLPESLFPVGVPVALIGMQLRSNTVWLFWKRTHAISLKTGFLDKYEIKGGIALENGKRHFPFLHIVNAHDIEKYNIFPSVFSITGKIAPRPVENSNLVACGYVPFIIQNEKLIPTAREPRSLVFYVPTMQLVHAPSFENMPDITVSGENVYLGTVQIKKYATTTTYERYPLYVIEKLFAYVAPIDSTFNISMYNCNHVPFSVVTPSISTRKVKAIRYGFIHGQPYGKV